MKLVLPFTIQETSGPLPALLTPCILIVHANVMDDRDPWYLCGKMFSVLFVHNDGGETALWRGHSYDDAIRASFEGLRSHAPVFPGLADVGIIDHVVRRPV